MAWFSKDVIFCSGLSKYAGAKPGTVDFSVCHSFNKHCAPLGEALQFSTDRTWSQPSEATVPAYNPMSQPGAPAFLPTTPYTPHCHLTPYPGRCSPPPFKAGRAVIVTSGDRKAEAHADPRGVTSRARARIGFPTLDPRLFQLLEKSALSWKTNNVDKEAKDKEGRGQVSYLILH